MKAFCKRGALFVLIGLLIYAGVYYFAELLVYKYGKRNGFYVAATASAPRYDYAILGASHALPLGFENMNERLEKATGASILNVATPGGGLVPNRVVLDYLLARREIGSVVYLLDSFVFYSSEWNEDRLKDVRLFRRAPLDRDLVRVLVAHNVKGDAPLGTTLDYVSGFSKINNADRFAPDVSEDELKRFGRTYRPSSTDARRLAYLYPAMIDPETFDKYVSTFVDLIADLRSRGIGLIVVRPPIPRRFYDRIPNESEFERRIGHLLASEQIPYYDFALVDNDAKFFFDTDHLNRSGVSNFFDSHLARVLAEHRRVKAKS
jgi:hypothetical protein